MKTIKIRLQEIEGCPPLYYLTDEADSPAFSHFASGRLLQSCGAGLIWGIAHNAGTYYAHCQFAWVRN